jgi:diguanylate cyclase (GGDEF)-like protein/PAS domain S-box-containing protein
MSRFARHPLRNALLIAMVWTAALAASLLWAVRQGNEQALELATNAARSNFDKDLAYRSWASGHGGVYVPPTASTPPSPWMAHIPDRDVVTTDGKRLTLMNPAYMLRQMMGEFSTLYGVKGRIVGRVALNSNNLADPWEADSIAAFEKGVKEILERSDIAGKPYLRLIKPMWMDATCMKCHGHLGFKVGDIRGAVSVSVPMDPYLSVAADQSRNLSITYAGIWLIGLVTVLWSGRRGVQLERERQRVFDETSLASKVFEDGLEGVIIADPQGVIVRVNPAFTMITGFSAADAVGNKPSILKSGRHDHDFYQRLWGALLKDGRWEGEIWNRRKSGEGFVATQTISAVRNHAGEVVHYVSTFRDVTERIQSEDRMRHLAHYDGLTHLPNRTLFVERLEHATIRANRERSSLALLFIDLDYFKAVNDSLGHAAGDDLLCIMAKRMRDALRESDTVARLAGDEFAVFMEGVSEQSDIDGVLQKLIDALHAPADILGRSVAIGGSIGVAVFPRDGQDAETLLRAADTAMYRAKEKGRGRFAYYQPDLAEHADDRFTVISELRHGLEHGEFCLHYQPKVDAHTGQLVGLEALVRWQHPHKGMIPPDRFISLAEQTDLIVPLGDWVLRAACLQAVAWNAGGRFANLKMAVNLSGVQIARGGLLDRVREILDSTGLAPEQLELEVTEGVMVEGMREGFKTLNALKELGIGIAIDDFGTGYSSLAALKQLPMTRLKIDRSFVCGLPTQEDDLAIAEMVVRMAESLKLQVTAEGVETAEQVACLRELGCHELQGYYFSRPLTAQALEASWPVVSVQTSM